MDPCGHDDLIPSFRAGFNLIRIKAGQKIPFPGWPTESTSQTEIAEWVASGGNVGWRLGDADLVVDVDPRNFLPDTDPFRALVDLCGLDAMNAPHVLTAGGGHHFYFIKPVNLAIRETLLEYPGIEFKTTGRQVLLPPSFNAETKRHYEWDDLSAAPSHRPNAPHILLDLIQRTDVAVARSSGGELSVEQLEGLLSRTPAEAFTHDHTEWFTFMTACHHATAGAGGSVFEAWSQTDPLYARDTTIRVRWDSLDPNHPNPITIQSFTHKLRELGVEMTELIVQPYLDSPLPPLDIELDDAGLDQQSQVIREMNEKHCTIFNSKYHIGTRRYDSDLDRYYYVFSRLKDFMDAYSNESVETLVPGKGGAMFTALVNKALFWQNHPDRRSYESVIFAPNQIIPKTLNLWQGFSVEPVQGNCELFFQLVREVLAGGNEEVYTYIMRWLAYMVQQPQHKAKVALVLRGDKGAGKGFFATAVTSLIRSHALHAVSSDQILGRFNSHLQSTKLLYADEAFWAGSKDLEGVLKGLITEDFCTYEAKYMEMFAGRSCLNIIIASNNDWVVPTSPGDERRFCIMNVTNTWRGNFDLFDAFEKQMYSKGGLEALMYHLSQEVILGDWVPWRDIPHTEGLAEQIKEGFDDVQDWLYECLTDGKWPGAEETWPETQGSHWAPTGILHQSYLNYMEKLKRRTYVSNKVHFSRRLHKFLGVHIHTTQKRIDGEPIWGLELPCLVESRKIFDTLVKYGQNWHDTGNEKVHPLQNFPLDSDIWG